MLVDVYSAKQRDVLKFALTHDFFMLINHGAKRSGKTIIDNEIFLCELRRVRRMADEAGVARPQYILAASDLSSIQRNVLVELSNRYGLDFTFDKFNRFSLFGVLVCCFGHSKITDMGRIRGMTAWGAYINEASVANPAVFSEIRNRCSAPGARLIMDTNPDRPSHWLKRDYIDKADGRTIKAFQWSLDDNSFLSDRYIESIKASTPSGVFYDRDIRGLWVSPAGVVYPDIDGANWVTGEDLPAMSAVCAGMDFGWEHSGAVVLIGEGLDGFTYILRAWSAKHCPIGDWAALLEEVAREYGSFAVYCDSARPDLISELIEAGIDARPARKDVMSGISHVASMMRKKTLKINRDGVPDDFRQELDSYTWQPDKDAPVKQNDDIMDALRYGLYTRHMEEAERPRAITGGFLRGGLI